jgi:hypothetical protein
MVNRIANYSRRFEFTFPAQQPTQIVPVGFAICPAVLMAHAAAQQYLMQLYQQAYEQARRSVVPFYMKPLLAGN